MPNRSILMDEYVPQHRPAPRVVDAAKTKKQAEKVEQFATFSQLKVHACYRGDVNGATEFLKNVEQALTLCGLSTCLERWDYRLF